jgi:molybdenum cofactor synthesis domain-containing protein
LDESAFDLLDKNELSIVGIELTGANLNEVAAAVADVLDLERREVLVTDYLDRVVTVDILRRAVYPHQLLTSSESLLDRVAAVPGVRLDPDAAVRSRGMLGWIAADSEGLEQVLAQAQRQAEEILQRVAKRVMIFSTGAELVDGQVEDTNAATITARLGQDGYACDHGGALRDDADLIAGAIRSAIANGYGMVVTTGGVGAEAKDCTVEAVLKVDPSAATPYICHFEIDHGRHVKDGIRVAVGRRDGSLIVALPGPNDEVRSALEVLCRELRNGAGHEEMAIAIARDLRGMLRDRMGGNS